jgi:hypothetical protein
MKSFTGWRIDQNFPPISHVFKQWRELKLQQSDWMALSDTPTIGSDWSSYRQSLRDLPENANYPNSLEIPNFVPLDPNGD